MTILRRPFLAAFCAPLAIALAACGSEDVAGDAALNGAAIAPIAAPQGQSWVDMALETPEGGFLVGNPDAPLKLLEYASHTCSHCATFSQESHAKLRDEYIASGRVSYELRNQIHDPIDLTISMLARCSGPAAFQPLSDQAWANFESIITTAQANNAAISAASQQKDGRYFAIAEAAGLLDFFAARGISRDQAQQCLGNEDLAKTIIERSETQSEELDVTGTPTFFINGSRVDGTAWSRVEPALQNAGAR